MRLILAQLFHKLANLIFVDVYIVFDFDISISTKSLFGLLFNERLILNWILFFKKCVSFERKQFMIPTIAVLYSCTCSFSTSTREDRALIS